jgi:hypothetical protein
MQEGSGSAAPAATNSSSTSSPGGNTSSSGGSSKGRTWGAWKANARIKAANVALIKDDAVSGAIPPKQQQQPAPAAAPAVPAVTPDAPLDTDDGASIVSRKFGVKRPLKVKRDPVVRQNMVQDALRRATTVSAQEQQAAAATGSSSSGSGGGGKQWWQEQFQAVFLPSIKNPDGSVGFVQMDVSLNPDVRDVRVLSFEDRHDCMTCLTVLRQWAAMADAQLSMGAMPSAVVEEEIR